MVSICEDKVGNVSVSPVLEEPGIPVLAFGIEPHVEALGHHYDPQRVVNLHLGLRGHIVGGPDGVCPHVFKNIDLADNGSFVDSRT